MFQGCADFLLFQREMNMERNSKRIMFEKEFEYKPGG